ncbi:hypothetical protein CEB3_c43270 [Peptococcaceae bacterium CEB3]|nr:hypothetical protein CEB3_c43270 [Peptococcaceae bacterium CEB3]
MIPRIAKCVIFDTGFWLALSLVSFNERDFADVCTRRRIPIYGKGA